MAFEPGVRRGSFEITVPISTDGGISPIWSSSGDELFYRQGATVVAVSVDTTSRFEADAPNVLLEGPYLVDPSGHPNYAVSSDGQRFLMAQTAGSATKIEVVLNWFEELTARVPCGRD